jgi:hypothetical protein
MANPLVNSGTLFFTSSSTNTSTTGSITPSGNVTIVQTIVQANVYVSSITDTAGDTAWVSAVGTYGNMNSKINLGSFYFSAFYCYAVPGSPNTVTVNLSGNSGSTFLIAYYDCANIASSLPFLGAIANLQNGVANGPNAVSVAMGTGAGNSDNITSTPALVCTVGYAGGGTLTAGSSPTTLTAVANSSTNKLSEYGVATSSGTFDSTFTLAGASSPTCLSWQIALAGVASVATSRPIGGPPRVQWHWR